jgi:hypothetical protein
MNIQQIRQQYPQYSDLSDRELADLLRQRFYADMPENEFYARIGFSPASTIGSELVRGGRQVLSGIRTTAESIFDSPEAAAQRGLERGQAIAEEAGEGPSLDRIKRVYREQGVLPAAGQVLSDIPKALAGQAANLAGIAGSAKLGWVAGAPLGPVGSGVGAAVGAGAYLLPQFFGSNIERQAAEDLEQGRPVDIETGKALTAATGQAAVEAAGTAFILGGRIVKGILGIEAAQAATSAAAKAALVKKAQQSLTRTLAGGALRGTTEVPVEIAQQIIERAQAGMDVLSSDALEEYGNAAYQAGLIGPVLGGAGNVVERGGARKEIAREEEAAAAEAQKARAEAAKQEEQRQEAFRQSPEYLQDLQARYDAVNAEVARAQRAKKPVLPKNATPAQILAHEEATAAYETEKARNEQLLQRARDVRKEYREAAPRLEQLRTAEEQRNLAIEQDAAQRQPMAADVARGPGEQQQLPGFITEPSGQETDVLAAEQERRLYGREGRQAELEGVFDQADQRDALAERIETPYQTRARLERDVRSLEDMRNRLREQAQGTQDPETLRSLAEQDQQLFNYQKEAQRQIEAIPLEPIAASIKSVDASIKKLQKQLANAQENGDITTAAKAAENLAEAQARRASMSEQTPIPESQFDLFGGQAESVDSFNQRVVGPEIGAERQRREVERSAAEERVSRETEALQRIQQRDSVALDAIQQRRGELPTKYEVAEMERQAAMNRGRTAQGELFAERPTETVTPSRVTPEALSRLIARAENSPNLPLQDQLLLEDVKDVLPALAQSPNRAQLDTVADWLYRSATGNPNDAMRGEVENLLQQAEAGRRSETEQLTEAQQRAMTPEERRATQGIVPGRVAGPQTSLTGRRGVMERAPTGPVRTAIQTSLPGVEPTATAFNTWQEFEQYLAGTGLAQIRDAMGLEGDTVSRQLQNIQTLERTVNRLRSQIAAVEAQRKAAQTAGDREVAAASAMQNEAQNTLAALQLELDAEMRDMQIRYLESAQKLYEAQQAAADLSQQVSENMGLLERQIADYEQQVGARDARVQALRTAQAELKTLVDAQTNDKGLMAQSLANIASGLPFDVHNGTFTDARIRVINRRHELVTAHQKLMQANAAVPAMPKLSSMVFRDFLVRDAELQAALNTAQSRLGGFKAARNKAKAAMDAAFKAQQARPEVIKALDDAQSDVRVAEELLAAATEGRQAQLLPLDAELRRIGADAGPLIRRLEDAKRKLPQAAERRRQQAETGREVSARQRREEAAATARAEQTKRTALVEGATTVPREQVSFPAKERRYQTLDRMLDRLSWQDPQTETALKQWVARQDRLQGEFDASTQQLIDEQIARIEAFEKLKAEFPNQKSRHAKAEKVIRNQSRILAGRLDWVASKASGTLEARAARISRTPVLTAQQRQEQADRTLRETRGQPLTEEQAEELSKAPRGRALGPAAKSVVAAPTQLRTSSPESRAGESRTSSKNPITEKRGAPTRDTKISKKEQNAANKAAAEIDPLKQQIADVDARIETVLADQSRIKGVLDAAEKSSPRHDEAANDLRIVQSRIATLMEEKRVAEKAYKQTQETVVAEAQKKAQKLTDKKTKVPPVKGLTAPVEDTMTSLDEVGLDLPGGEALFSAVRDDNVYDERPVVALSPEAMEAARDGRILDLLDELAQNASTAFNRALAARLRPLVMRTKLRTRDGGVFDENGLLVEAVFRPKDNTVEVSDSALFEETVLHEIAHAVTVNQLDADPNTLTPEQRSARQELESLLAQVRKDPAFDKQYGRLNSKELVAEVLSNKDFRDRLDKMKPTLLRRIYNAMLRFLGMTPQSVSERAVENAYALFAPSKVSSGRAVPSVLRGVFPGSSPKYGSAIPKDVQDLIATPKNSTTLGQKATAAGLGFRTLALDRWAPMEYLLKLGVEKGKLSETQATQMRLHMRLHEDANRFAAQSLTNGVVQLQEENGKRYYGGAASDVNMRTVVRHISEAGETLGNSEARLELWQRWMEINRVERKRMDYKVIDGRMTREDAQKIKALVNSNDKIRTAFENARETYKQYNRDLMRQAAEAGTLPADVAKNLADMDYIPFYRTDGDTVVLDGIGSKPFTVGSLLDQPYLKELVGDTRARLPVLDAVVQNTSMLTRMNIRNMQAKDAANVLQTMGLGKVVVGEGPSNVLRFKDGGGMYWLKLDPEAFPPGVTPEMLLSGMQGIKAAVPTILKVAGIPTRVLRATITRMPLYVVRQMIRDPLFAWLTTGGKFTPVVSSIKELTKIRRGLSPTEETLARSGAISSNVMTGDYQDAARMLRDLSVEGKSAGAYWNKGMAALDNFAMQADASTRAVLYDSFRKQGMDHTDALLGAAESMNFARRGTSSSLYMWSTLVPFFNAQLQGIDAMYRAVKGDTVYQKRLDVRNTLLKRGTLMLAATLAYSALMQDDEAYKNATPEERAMNWFVRVPGLDDPVRVPIPFEPGLIFKAIPEAIFNAATTDETAKDAMKAIGKQLWMSTPLQFPAAVNPLIELATNYSFFTDSPIESSRERSMDSEYRVREGTTEMSKLLGQTGGLSPVQIEHLVRGYFSSAGILALSMANYPLRPLVSPDAPDRAERTLSQMPLFGPAFQPTNGRGAINAAYDDVLRFQQAHQTFTNLVNSGRGAEARAYANEFAREIALASTGGAFKQQMGELAAMKRQINASALPPDEKRARLDEIRRIEIRLAQQVRSMTRAEQD